MTHTNERLRELGERIASEQDASLMGDPGLADVRERISLNSRTWRARSQRIAVGLALAAFVAATVLVLLHLREPAPLRMSVAGGASVQKPVGTWVAAAKTNALPVEFSDGSRILLAPESRARIVEVNQNGAHLVVESGAAQISIVPREAARWRFSFGPFSVEVLGTQFDVVWNPEADLFELTLNKGKVRVSGCMFGDGRAVLAGETVRASCKSRQFEIKTRSTESASKALGSNDVQASAASAPKMLALTPASSGSSDARAVKAPRWQDLARTNKYGEAYAAASSAGFESECKRIDVEDLWLLGAAARLTGHPADAELAYRTLRARFARSDRAALAAYDLARIAFDQRRAYTEAARWFQVYLAEQPRGQLAREALGRLMEAEYRSGDRGAAKESAQRYLTEYPAGPHVALARSLAPSVPTAARP